MVKLLPIDEDSIFRLGLQTWIDGVPDLQLVAEAASAQEALQLLAEPSQVESLDLVILDWDIAQFESEEKSPFYQQLQRQYPSLPLFLLTTCEDPEQLAIARKAGIQGYCRKGTPLSQLAIALREVASGRIYWQQFPEEGENSNSTFAPSTVKTNLKTKRVQKSWQTTGLRYIQADLTWVDKQLKNSRLEVFDRIFLQGRRRELVAAHWMAKKLLSVSDGETAIVRDRDPFVQPISLEPFPPETDLASISESSDLFDSQGLQSELFDRTFAKLQSNLSNLTQEALEIDILNIGKKRELLYTILRQFEILLDELSFSQVQPQQISKKSSKVLLDLWQETINNYFGKYYTLTIQKRQVELVNVLLKDADFIRFSILDKIPLIEELFSYLLFKTPLNVDNRVYEAGSLEAKRKAEQLLQNLLLQVANAVVQPLLNHFADVEIIKQNFYDRRLLSTREIERFRNELSWKYRVQKYIGEPKAVYESHYSLLVLDNRSIQKIEIYAPRREELEQLSGVQQAVTLVLEGRDAISPRVRSVVAFVGSSLVYVLTQVVGRGLGLIARGVLDGMGSVRQNARSRKDRDRRSA